MSEGWRPERKRLSKTPLPPDGPDFLQKKLFEGRMVCFYGAEVREPPADWGTYCTDEHIEVRFANGRNSFFAIPDVDGDALTPPVVSVSNFSTIPLFVKGSAMIASELDYMSLGPLSELNHAPLPFACKPVSVFQVQRRRDNTDPAHRWLRDKLAAAVKALPPSV